MQDNDEKSKKRILLIGPPNVGKSVIFNSLTGLDVSISNYVGTTVDYQVGTFELDKRQYSLIDVPGIYTLNAINQAEEIALKILAQKPEAVIFTIDAKNLENGLFLLLQVLKKKIKTIAVINRIDLIEEKGYHIDTARFSEILEIPVVAASAVQGKGLEEIKTNLKKIMTEDPSINTNQLPSASWEKVEQIASQIKVGQDSNKILRREKWGDLLVQPWPGLPLAIIIMALVFAIVVGIGMGLRQFILLPFFDNFVFPPIIYLTELIIPSGVIRNILIGEYGFLIKGLEWPLALVFPYVVSFYSALSLLEDSGYLPRLGILIDGILNKIGLTGSSVIPLLLGYGCAIPGITATRALNSYKEKLIVSVIMCLSIPCVAQSGAFIALLAERSILVVFVLFLFSIFFLIASAIVMDRFLKDIDRTDTLIEIPELLWPRKKILFKKIWIRIKHFLLSGELTMVYAIALAAVLYETGILIYLGSLLEGIVSSWLLLPEEAAIPLLLGIIRRELTVLPLLEMDLTSLQLFVAAVVGLFYVPCIAVLAFLYKEFNLKTVIAVLSLTIFVSFLMGGIISRIGLLFF